jgi:hypothetical protein
VRGKDEESLRSGQREGWSEDGWHGGRRREKGEKAVLNRMPQMRRLRGRMWLARTLGLAWLSLHGRVNLELHSKLGSDLAASRRY